MSLQTSSKEKEVTFDLNEGQKNEKIKINNVNELIIKLKEEIKKEVKKEIKELKNIINNQNKEINELKEQIRTWLIYKKNKIIKISELKTSFIIDNNIEYNKSIKTWINPNKIIRAELLYRFSRDGDQISKFHELCDNKGPTLTLFETEDGNKGGIYTPLSWDSNSEWKNDKETFIFNLIKNEKYKKLISNYSINCKKDFGPWIGCFGFYPTHQMRKIVHNGLGMNSYFDNGAEILPNNTGNIKNFNVKEIEIYKIII